MRPGNELTAGSLNVLAADDTFTRKIDRFAGTSMVAIALSYYETTATKKRRTKEEQTDMDVQLLMMLDFPISTLDNLLLFDD
jgi:hypothetical protein